MQKNIPALLIFSLCAIAPYARAQAQATPPDPEFDELLSLDIADLSVTSVSKRSQKLTDTAAAIYVITQEDMRRSGATSIPEALRLVPGVQVAKVASNRWAISARGFNGPLANKLLVLLDGRTLYTPVFSGVYWDDQSTLIEDIDRIEVIRGPGASLYGANAVNGVINIITKTAEETQGNLVSLTGTTRGGLVEGRHGGKLGENTYYRAYATYQDASKTNNPTTNKSNFDDWNRARTGFRMDTRKIEGNSYTLQGDFYTGTQQAEITEALPAAPLRQTVRSENDSLGGNILGRWNHTIDSRSQLMLQGYVDHYSRIEDNFIQHVTTADVQAQHTIALDARNNFIWGGGARFYDTRLEGTYSTSVNEEVDNHHVLNTFVQDEYAILPEKLYLTLGSKFEYYDLNGFQVEPSARLSWHPTQNQTVWGAVSRAVRTPSIYEEDINVVALTQAGAPNTELRIIGNRAQESEELVAYELGHRIQPVKNVSLDTALFYNNYDKLQTFGTPLATYLGANGNNVQPYPITNLGSGHTYGAEFAGNWKVTGNWRLAGSYTYTRLQLDTATNVAATLAATEKLTPRNEFALQSYYSPIDEVHWDNMLYFISSLRTPADAYLRYDTRVAWLATPGLELSIIGRNLFDPRHVEYPATPQAEISRAFIGQVLWKF